MTKKIQFDANNSLINQLECEIPTKFCSIRPVVVYKRLFDDGNEILFEWDKDDESKLIDVIIMLQGWRRFYLEVEFTENQRYYDFELEAKEKGFFEIKDIEKKPPQSGKVIFEFRLKLEEFIGEDTLEFKLTESDICGYEIDVNIPIVFENVTRNFHKQDIKKVLKNQPTLAELNIIHRIQNLSNKLNKSYEKIEKWLNNFEEEEKKFAIKLLENFRYIDTDELNEICSRLYTKLLEQVGKKLKDIQFIAFDEFSKSSHMIAYNFALAQSLPQENFITVYNIDFSFPTNKVIVYIDDVIGSGRQFLENWNKFKNEMTSINKAKFEKFLSSNEFINLPLFTTLEGKDNVEYNSVFKVIYLEHNLLKKNHMALELESGIFTKEQIPKVREILEKYGKNLYPKGPLG